VTVPADDPAADPVESPEVGFDQVQVGNCIDAGDGTVETVTLIACARPHDGEIFAIRNLRGARWPGERAVHEQSGRACELAFQPYIGIGYDSSYLVITTYEPTADSWPQGDHRTFCVVSEPKGKTVGGLRGAKR
jgi:hypothetical protein